MEAIAVPGGYAFRVVNKLSQRRIDELWLAYQEHESVHAVSKKCGVHWKTVDRYRLLERWDERIADARRRAQDEADYDLARAMAASLRLVTQYKSKLAEALDRMTVLDDDVTASELEKVIKLEGFLLGGVESRHEVVGRFEAWTDDELERFAERGEVPSRSSGSKA